MEITTILSHYAAQPAAPSTTPGDQATERTSQGQNAADTVDISEEGRRLAAEMQRAEETGSGDEADETANPRLEALRKLIEMLKREIEEIEQSDMSDEEKERKLSTLRNTLTQTQLEYAQALQEGNGGGTPLAALGTPAEGFPNSLT